MRSDPGCSSIEASVCRICTRRSPGFGRLRTPPAGTATTSPFVDTMPSEGFSAWEVMSGAPERAQTLYPLDSGTHVRGLVAMVNTNFQMGATGVNCATKVALHPHRFHADPARRALVGERVLDQDAAARTGFQPGRKGAEHARVGLRAMLAEHLHVLDADDAVEQPGEAQGAQHPQRLCARGVRDDAPSPWPARPRG